MLQIGLMADGALHSCLNVKEGDDAGSGGQILVSFLSLNHDDSLTRSFCSPTLTNPVFLTKWSVDHWRFFCVLYFTRVRPERRWLSHCATSRKVVVSIPDGGIESFHLLNPSSLTMNVGLSL